MTTTQSPQAPAAPVLYHYYRSSSSWRVRWALHLKGIAFTPVAVNLLTGEQRAPAHLARSPLGFVPLLGLGDPALHLAESLAIIEYLDELYPAPPLLPQDPLGRARVRQLAQVVSADTQPLQNTSVLEHVGQLLPDPGARKAWAQRFIRRGLDVYEALVSAPGWPAGRFSHGDELTIADLCLIPQLYNARRQGLDVAAWPRLAAIEAVCMQTEAAQRSSPEAYAPPGAPV